MSETSPQVSASVITLPPKLENSPLFKIVILATLVLVILLPRATGLATYGTADEPNYLKFSASFYYLLKEGRFGETDLIVHPGVTDLWSGALGVWMYYPEYANNPKTEFPLADLHFSEILGDGDMAKASMLALDRRFVVAFQVATLATAFYFGWQAFGFFPALLAVLLVSFDPFYFANSRILQPDSFLAVSMLLGLTALLAYLRTGKNLALLASAAATGLAILSKVPGVFLLPVSGLLLAADWWGGQGAQHRSGRGFARLIGVYLMWLAVVVLTIFTLWPAMWVQPLETLKGLISFTQNASAQVNSPMFFNGQILPEGEFGLEYWYYYPLSFLWRTSPVILLGFAAGLAGLWLGRKHTPDYHRRFALLSYLSAGLLMVVFFTLSAKKFDRYILPSMLYLDIVAAFGYLSLLGTLLRRGQPAASARWLTAGAALVVLVGWQAGLVWQSAPYYHAYYNPWLGGVEKAQEVMMVGWGEGLNQAAQYLNNLDSPQMQEVYSFYSSTLDLHFTGRSFDLPISGPVTDELFADILDSDYVVIYLIQRQRQSASRVLDYLADKPPAFVGEIEGVPFVWVYDMAEITGRAGEH